MTKFLLITSPFERKRPHLFQRFPVRVASQKTLQPVYFFPSLFQVEWVLNGTWDSKLEGSKVIKEALVRGKSSLEIGPSHLLWKVRPIQQAAEKYYNFTR